MRKKSVLIIGTAIAITIVAIGLVAHRQRTASALDHNERINATIDALVRRNDADSLATAAQLAMVTQRTRAHVATIGREDESRALELARRAASAAPDDPAILWLWSNSCGSLADCDVMSANGRFRKAAPDNAAGWLVALTDAWEREDDAAIDEALQRMARSTHFDLYWNEIVVRMTDALNSVAGPGRWNVLLGSSYSNLVTAVGLASGQLPEFAPLSSVCKEAHNAARRQHCGHIASLMQSGDSVLVQSLGLRFDERWAAAGSVEAHAALEKRRALDWLMDQTARIDNSLWTALTGRMGRERLALMRQHGREEDVMRALLAAHGVVTEPPAEWMKAENRAGS